MDITKTFSITTHATIKASLMATIEEHQKRIEYWAKQTDGASHIEANKRWIAEAEAALTELG